LAAEVTPIMKLLVAVEVHRDHLESTGADPQQSGE
jgi:hypothetical protein